MTEGLVRLRDGRQLAWAEHGAPDGVPVLYFHGTLGSRLEGLLVHEAARRQGIRVICTDRPGHGRSSPHPERTFRSWAEDVRELADALGFRTFGVVGLSGGGAHAACVAAALPERVSRLALVSAAGPPEVDGVAGARTFGVRLSIALVRRTVLHLRLLGAVMGFLARAFGERFLRTVAAIATPGDRRALRTPGVAHAFTAAWAEGTRQGTEGAALDLRLQLLPWDMVPSPPDCPVDLWYGLEDRITPAVIGRHYLQGYPGAQWHEFPGEGHLVIALHGDEILAPFRPAEQRASA